MLNTKDAAGFFAPLAAHVADLMTVAIPGAEAGLPAAVLAKEAAMAGLKAKAAPDVGTALAQLAAAAKVPARFLICGSLYLAGAVLADNA